MLSPEQAGISNESVIVYPRIGFRDAEAVVRADPETGIGDIRLAFLQGRVFLIYFPLHPRVNA